MTSAQDPLPRRPWSILGFVPAALLAGVAVASIAALLLTRSVGDVADHALRTDTALADEAEDVLVMVLQVRQAQNNLAFTGPTRAALGAFHAELDALLEEIEELGRVGIDPDLIRVDELRAQAVAYRDALLPRLDQFATDRDAFDDAIDLGLAALARLEARAEELDALGEERSVAALGNVESATTTATAVMALILVGVLVAGFVLVVVALRVLGELRRLAATQQATADQLRQALRARSDFIADASHELRTPLTVLRGNAEVGLAMGTTRCEHEPILRDIVAESERMTRLVGDLLFLARSGVGSTPLEPRTVELEPWLAEVAARGEVLCRQRDMPLDVDLAAVGTARIDPERTEQAVMVLIDNAAKFSPPGTPVRLEARLSDVELVIVVEDRGPGIPDDLRPYVFDRFRRGDRARGRRQSGAGLGLSIAQVIVDGQGGRIDAHDRPGGGTRMVIRLPRWGGPLSAAPIGTREPATAWDGP